MCEALQSTREEGAFIDTPASAKSVPYVSGTIRHLCLGSLNYSILISKYFYNVPPPKIAR